jgi:hypothetical protein
MQRAEAMAIGAPGGVRVAADEADLVRNVHCVPGWDHHGWVDPVTWTYYPWDGCRYGAWWLAIAPFYWRYGPRFGWYYWRPGWPGRIGRVGRVGRIGRIGRVGPPGRIGRLGPPGRIGRVGPPGRIGRLGPPGRIGRVGPPGRIGRMGGGFPSDAALKRDLVRVGELDNGLALYRFRYQWSDQPYVGVIAQEVLAVRPDVVTRGREGYLRVDYERLGVRLETWDDYVARSQ